MADVRSTGLNTPPEADYFLPALQRPETFTNILVRTDMGPVAMAPLVREALRSVDPELPLLQPQTLDARIAETVANRRLALVLLAGFAALALVLASLGVYSVMAHLVAFRTSEIGIRMALGASPRAVMRMVLGHGRRLTLIGIALGIGGALAVSRLMQQALFEVDATDPLIYLALSLTLLLVAECASVGCRPGARDEDRPGHRAAHRRDPSIASRWAMNPASGDSLFTRRAFLAGALAAAGSSGLRIDANQPRRTRLILLGTGGGPRPRAASSAAAQVIVIDNVAYVVDCGDGVARQLVLAGVPLPALRHVFITHHHSDHNADYGNLGRRRPRLPVAPSIALREWPDAVARLLRSAGRSREPRRTTGLRHAGAAHRAGR